jgi:hypothetical protein
VIDSAAMHLDQDDPTAVTAEPVVTTPPPAASTRTSFAHASEAEMARILEFYEVRWEYEPTTFPILWNVEGDVIESFAPDFYLPDLDMYLELTTLQQRLVRKKNRKLRRLRELYPDVRIKLFYARDFRAMMLKYGRLGLAASLSGSVGQLGAIRPAEVDPVATAGPEATAGLGAAASRRGTAALAQGPGSPPHADPMAVPDRAARGDPSVPGTRRKNIAGGDSATTPAGPVEVRP